MRVFEKHYKKERMCCFLHNDVSQDPKLDQTAHDTDPPVPHQHLAWGLILEKEVGDGVSDLALHLLLA